MDRIFNILWRTLVFFVVMVILGYGLLHIPFVQTQIVKFCTSILYFGKGVDISVGSVDFVPIRSLHLGDLLVKDFKGDTLLSSKKLELQISSINFVDKDLKLSQLLFEEAEFVVWRDADTTAVSRTNISRLIDSLRGGPKVVDSTKRETSPDTNNLESVKRWLVDLERVVIKDSRFRYINSVNEPRDYGVDWTNIDCLHWNAEVTNLHIGDTSTFSVRNMNFVEKSGLQCKNVDGDLHFMRGHVMVTDVNLALKESDVYLDRISFQWNPQDGKSWSNYCQKIYQTYLVREPSYVNFRDIAYFNGILRGIENTVHVKGVVKNTIDKLEGENLEFRIEDKTTFTGKFKSYGLPDVTNTIFDIDVVNGYFSPYELSTIYLPWFKRKIPVPSPMMNFDIIRGDFLNFDGKFTEFDLKARTSSNGFRGDIMMTMGTSVMHNVEINDFWGQFSMSQLDMGRLTGVKDLGEASVYGEFSGARDSVNIYTGVETEWPFVNLGQDKIENLSAYIMLDNNVNHIIAQTNDNGVFADVVMTIETDEESKSSAFDFMSATAQVVVEDLGRFGYSLADSVESLGVNAKYLAAGSNDDSYKRLYLSDFEYENSRGYFMLDTLLAEIQSNGERQEVKLNSEPVSLYAEGKLYDMMEKGAWSGLYTNYLPSLEESVTVRKKIGAKRVFDDFDFRVELLARGLDSILPIVNPELYVQENSLLSVDFSNRDSLVLNLESDSVRWNDVQAKALRIRLQGDTDSVYARVDAESLRVDTVMGMYNLMNETTLLKDSISNRVFWGNWGEKSYAGDLKFDINFSRDRENILTSAMQLYDGVMVFEDSVWNVSKSKIALVGEDIVVDDFKITKGKSYVKVDGVVSAERSKNLNLDVNQISLRRVAHYVPAMKRVDPFGMLSGGCSISDYYSKEGRSFEVALQLDNWGVGNDTLGTLSVNSLWDKENQEMILRGENRYDKMIPFSLYAIYKPETDSIDMEVLLETVRIERLNHYFNEYITGTSGGVSGEILCHGKLDNPQIFGTIYLDSIQMTVNTLGTSFAINDKIDIQGNRVNLNNFVLRDVNGNSARLNGYYSLFDSKYNLEAQMEQFTLMNTNASYNDSFYGRLCVSGYSHIHNQNDEMNIAVDWATTGSSVLYLPLTAGVNDDAAILTFVTPKQSLDLDMDMYPPSTFAGINLDANVEVNDNLEVQVIFDPSIGDVLTCTGDGNLKFTIDRNDNLGMSGEYRVESGDYLFTLGGIWNKHFVLERGGTIVWNGTPYDATLNLQAIYNLRTSLYELYASVSNYEQNDSEARRKVPVQCVLKLSDRLSNPVIGLDVDFPTLDNQNRSYIKNLFSTQDEVNKQVFSLLVMNKFTAPDYLASSSIANQAGAAGITTLTELVSTKLSKWISKFSNAFDLGVTYRMGDEITSDELELALSTQLFNDRMTISANGNVNVNNHKGATETSGSQIAGDFDVDVKLNKQGTLHLKAYSHTDEKILYNSSEIIQGIGLSYVEQFDTFKELLRKYASFFRKKSNKKNETK